MLKSHSASSEGAVYSGQYCSYLVLFLCSAMVCSARYMFQSFALACLLSLWFILCFGHLLSPFSLSFVLIMFASLKNDMLDVISDTRVCGP